MITSMIEMKSKSSDIEMLFSKHQTSLFLFYVDLRQVCFQNAHGRHQAQQEICMQAPIEVG